MSAQETHQDGECTYTFTKVMRPGAGGKVVLETVVDIEGCVTLGKLTHILRRANEFDMRWRAGLGIHHAGLKRIGRT